MTRKLSSWIPKDGKISLVGFKRIVRQFFYYLQNRYRREEDSDEELIFDSDDEYESDVPQDSLGKLYSSNSSWRTFSQIVLFHSQGLDNATDESDGESKKQPKKVRFTEAIKAATKAVAVDERKHPLLTDLEDDDSALKKKKKADKWFMKVRNSERDCNFLT